MAATALMHLVICSGQGQLGVAELAVSRDLLCTVPSKVRTEKDAEEDLGSGRLKACSGKSLLSQQSRSSKEVASSMVACCPGERRGSRWRWASRSDRRLG